MISVILDINSSMVKGIRVSSIVFFISLCTFIIIILVLYFLRWLGIVRKCYRVAQINDEHLLLIAGKKEETLKWSQVRAIYPSSFLLKNMKRLSSFELELTNGQQYRLFINRNESANILKDVFMHFLRHLNLVKYKTGEVIFSHPKTWMTMKRRCLWQIIILIIIILLPLIIVTLMSIIWTPVHSVELAKIVQYGLALLFISGVLSIPFIWQFVNLLNNKCITFLKIIDDNLTWRYEDGKEYTRSISEVKLFSIDALEGYLKFNDSVKLTQLEMLCYWPLLREYLRSKLETIEDHSLKS